MGNAWSRRRSELVDELDQIDAALPTVASPYPSMTARLQPVVHAEVERLREQLDRLPDDPSLKWGALGAIAGRTTRLAAETLALVGGLSAKAAGLDGRMCEYADRLIAEVAVPLQQSYHTVTVPAANEFIDMMSDVIRVRYPGAGLWDLPIVLHEFGHFLTSRIAASQGAPIRVIVEANKPTALAEELWADAFATYVCGPAYAFACLDRFPPVALDRDTGTHPAPVKRAATVLRVLAGQQDAFERSGKASGGLTEPIRLATEMWHQCRVEAGSGPDAGQGEAADDVVGAVAVAQQCIDVLDSVAVAARFDNAGMADDISALLAAGDSRPPQGCSLIDVLNGAWLARRRTPGKGAVLVETASTMFARVA